MPHLGVFLTFELNSLGFFSHLTVTWLKVPFTGFDNWASVVWGFSPDARSGGFGKQDRGNSGSRRFMFK